MDKQERDQIIARHLETPEGKRQFRDAFQKGCAAAADNFPEGSWGEWLARLYAGLPVKVPGGYR
jgi:hypothetical protein